MNAALKLAEELEAKSGCDKETWRRADTFCFDVFYEWTVKQTGANAVCAAYDAISMMDYLLNVLCGWNDAKIGPADFYRHELGLCVDEYVKENRRGRFKLKAYREGADRALRKIDAMTRETDDPNVKLFVGAWKKLTKRYAADVCASMQKRAKTKNK